MLVHKHSGDQVYNNKQYSAEYEPIPCLDHGFVKLVDFMGSDTDIVESAAVTSKRGEKTAEDDRNLINYLLRHKHTTPFEMVVFKFHCKMPIFVARQWIRHRMSTVNEVSARYSILDKEFYVPEIDHMGGQSLSNRQGQGDVIDSTQAAKIQGILFESANVSYEDYEWMLNDTKSPKYDPTRDSLARELARMNLSLNFYTQWYWKIDLWNLMNFLRLRMDPHAQYEIRVFANALAEFVKDICPVAYAAFEEYILYAITFSHKELKMLSQAIGEITWETSDDFGKREWNEFRAKLAALKKLRGGS